MHPRGELRVGRDEGGAGERWLGHERTLAVSAEKRAHDRPVFIGRQEPGARKRRHTLLWPQPANSYTSQRGRAAISASIASGSRR
jgi:hypothetical protein